MGICHPAHLEEDFGNGISAKDIHQQAWIGSECLCGGSNGSYIEDDVSGVKTRQCPGFCDKTRS